jgi:hypothetical protein
MDRAEALSLLKTGRIEEWNRLRASIREIPDLSRAVLRKAVLFGADLSGADLHKADLRGADLSRAVLRGAVLFGANLSRAVLFGADLRGVLLFNADLRGADLRGADLGEAILRRADLSWADLSGADLSGADLSGAEPALPEFVRPPTFASASLAFGLEPLFRRTPMRVPLGSRPTQKLMALVRRTALLLRHLIDLSLRAVDPVDCSIFAPPSVARGRSLIVQIFIHRPDQTEAARGMAHEVDEESRRRGFRSLKVAIERGTRLTVHIHVPGVEFDAPVQDIVWLGRPSYVAFGARVTEGVGVGILAGKVTISREGIPLGSIIFKIKIVEDKEAQLVREHLLPVGDKVRRYRRAFISYASQDRTEVLKRVQMLRLARIRYFQDVLKLEPGDRWERKLYLYIDRSDLFLLFWSRNAKESKWVLEEVRYAIKRKGGDDSEPPEIVPVIIEGPPVPEPPEELAHIHFNDYLIYFMKLQSLKS